MRRLLKASYWYSKTLIWWFVDHAVSSLPPDENGVCRLLLDTTVKDKTGKKGPVAKKCRLCYLSPYLFGIHIVIAVLQWGNYRIPIDFEIIRNKKDPKYRNANMLARWMLVRFQKPSWAKQVIVIADSGFSSKANMKISSKEVIILCSQLVELGVLKTAKVSKIWLDIYLEANINILGSLAILTVVATIGFIPNAFVCVMSEMSLLFFLEKGVTVGLKKSKS